MKIHTPQYGSAGSRLLFERLGCRELMKFEGLWIVATTAYLLPEINRQIRGQISHKLYKLSNEVLEFAYYSIKINFLAFQLKQFHKNNIL